ncbi:MULTISPECIES: hypothetical protein [Dermacoccus]|uniref:Uncharacterized protein n=3 Tax=Dermacoccus TaxID=57495 RepID=A0A417Z265_9MICO|nr:hypothetical protein [Dermacoccus abyssi]RHW44682.1 hypothetical protein D1832_11505 [Dermacoccus abyssi]
MSQHVTSGTTRPTHPSPGFSRNDARLVASLSGGLGALGAVVGLAVGLRTYTPTAWFAALEVGAPAAWLGLMLGLTIVGVRRLAARRRRAH